MHINNEYVEYTLVIGKLAKEKLTLCSILVVFSLFLFLFQC